MAYIGYFSTSGDLQTALNEENLVNPYVAYIADDDRIDYNSLEPEEPCYLGEWNYEGDNTYIFSVDTENTGWEDNPIKIGELLGVSADGNIGDLDIMLNYDTSNDCWHMEFFNSTFSNYPFYDFPGQYELWETGVMTDPNESGSVIRVEWDGTSEFSVQVDPNFVSTINPECE